VATAKQATGQGKPPRGYAGRRYKLEEFKSEHARLRYIGEGRARFLIRHGQIEGIRKPDAGYGYLLTKETVKGLKLPEK